MAKPLAFAITDKQGHYKFDIPTAGDYLVVPQAYGYARAVNALTPVSVAAGAAVTGHDLTVSTGGYRLSGQVTVQQTGKAVSGILIEAANDRYIGYALTDADGNYSMQLPLGAYMVGVAVDSVSSPSVQNLVVPESAAFTASLTGNIVENMALAEAGSTVSGYLNDETGNAVAGMLVTSTIVGESRPQAWVVTDNSGYYQFGATNGNLNINQLDSYSQSLGYVSSVSTVSVDNTDISGKIITATKADAYISGVVDFADSRKAVNEPVAFDSKSNDWSFTTQTAHDGTYAVAVASGDWKISTLSMEQDVFYL